MGKVIPFRRRDEPAQENAQPESAGGAPPLQRFEVRMVQTTRTLYAKVFEASDAQAAQVIAEADQSWNGWDELSREGQCEHALVIAREETP